MNEYILQSNYENLTLYPNLYHSHHCYYFLPPHHSVLSIPSSYKHYFKVSVTDIEYNVLTHYVIQLGGGVNFV